MKFSDRLKLAREQAGLSQRDLSAKSGVAQSLISQYETDTLRPSWKTLEKLAAALEKPVTWFLNENHPQ
jgi:transcriptional regulator with XRE-family HTH domain